MTDRLPESSCIKVRIFLQLLTKFQVFTEEGTLLRTIGGKDTPWTFDWKSGITEWAVRGLRGIAVTPKGDFIVVTKYKIFVSDPKGNFDNHSPQELLSLGHISQYPGFQYLPLYGLTSVVVDGKGRLLVCDPEGRTLHLLLSDGRRDVRGPSIFSQRNHSMQLSWFLPLGVAITPKGELIVTEDRRIQIFR